MIIECGYCKNTRTELVINLLINNYDAKHLVIYTVNQLLRTVELSSIKLDS